MRGGTTNVEAYEAWLRGWNLRKNDTTENFVAARDQFKKAIDLDPNFGAAQAAMTYIYWDATSDKRQAMGLTEDDVDREIVKYLAEAAKHPSTDYYGISGQFLVRQNRSDQAIEGLQKAMALNPSESWIYCDLAQATIFNGRPADALLFVEFEPQGYPEPTNWTHYLQGLAYFSMDRFDDAAASLEKVTLGSSSDYWASFYTAQVLLSTYGHQGRDADIAKLKERIKPILKEEIGDREFTIQLTQNILRLEESRRLRAACRWPQEGRRAGSTYGMDAKIKDRLTGKEITDLLVGHTASGVTTGALRKVRNDHGAGNRRNAHQRLVERRHGHDRGRQLLHLFPGALAQLLVRLSQPWRHGSEQERVHPGQPRKPHGILDREMIEHAGT